MIKNFTLLLLLLGSSLILQAQNKNQDVLYLKNGSVVRGQIIQNIPDSVIKIELPGPSVFVFKPSEIDSISHAPLERQRVMSYTPQALKANGYYGLAGAGMLVGNQIYPLSPIIFTSHGYMINRFVGFGLGVGVIKQRNANFFPIYGEVRGHLLKTPFTPYYHVSMGYTFPFRGPLSYFSPSVEGGIIGGGGVGVAIPLLAKLHGFIGFDYNHMRFSEESVDWWSGIHYASFHQLNRYSFNFGIRF